MPAMSQETCRGLFYYDPVKGLRSKSNRKITINKEGYPCYYEGKHRYKIANLTWIYFNGDIPLGLFVSNINSDIHNNKIENLRLVNRHVKHFLRYKNYIDWGLSETYGGYKIVLTLNGKAHRIGEYETVKKASAGRDKYLSLVKIVNGELILPEN